MNAYGIILEHIKTSFVSTTDLANVNNPIGHLSSPLASLHLLVYA